MAYLSLSFEIAHNHAAVMQKYAQRYSAYRASDPWECCKMVGDALLTRVNMLFRTVIGSLVSLVCSFVDMSRIKERCSIDLHMSNEEITAVEITYFKVIGLGFLQALGGILLPELIGQEIVGAKERIDHAIFNTLFSLIGDLSRASRSMGIDLNRLPDRGARLLPKELFCNAVFAELNRVVPVQANGAEYNAGAFDTLRNFTPDFFRNAFRAVLDRRYGAEVVQQAAIDAHNLPLPRPVQAQQQPQMGYPRGPVVRNNALVDHAAELNRGQVMATAIAGRIALGQNEDTIVRAIVDAFPVTIEEARNAIQAVRAVQDEAIAQAPVVAPRGDDQEVQQVINAQLADPQFGRVVTPALQEIHDAYLDAVRKACKELSAGEHPKYSVEDIASVDPDAYYAVLQMAVLIMCESAYVVDNSLSIPYVSFRKSGSGYDAQQKELHLSERYDSHRVYSSLKEIHKQLHALEGKKALLNRLREKLTAKTNEPEQAQQDDKAVQDLFKLIGALKTEAMERTVATLKGDARGPTITQVLQAPNEWMNR